MGFWWCGFLLPARFGNDKPTHQLSQCCALYWSYQFRHSRARVQGRRAALRTPVPPDVPAGLSGRRGGRIGRRAKYLLIFLEGGTVLIAHLCMSGRLGIFDTPPPPGPHDHVVLHLDDGAAVVYTDPRRFGLMTGM